MVEERNKKLCFFITPIGDEKSDIRKRSDQVFRHIIKSIAEKCGYEASRADQMSESGYITSQVINHLMDDDLVIADLTDGNPNVYYELAIRHCVKKPVILIMQSDQKIPFDVSGIRIIHFNYQDLDSVEACKKNLINQIKSIEQDPPKIDSPISAAINLNFIMQSDDPVGTSNAEIISKLQDIQYRISNIESSSLSKQYMSPSEEWELLTSFERVVSNLRKIKYIINTNGPTMHSHAYTHYESISWDEGLSEFLNSLKVLIEASNLSAQTKSELTRKINYYYIPSL